MGARVLPSSLLVAAAVAVAALMTTTMAVAVEDSAADNIQPLSTLKMQAAQVAMDSGAAIHASPDVLGKNGEDSAWVTVNFTAPAPSADHWVALFSPADFGYTVHARSSRLVISRVKMEILLLPSYYFGSCIVHGT
ncbi:unnamed protein product [Urochloa humidicola]